LATIADRGSVGVLVFFTISGFVLAMPFIQRRIRTDNGGDLGRYYLRRVTRIEPPYIVAMVLAFLAAHAIAGEPSFGSLGASLAYIHQPLYGASSPANASAWRSRSRSNGISSSRCSHWCCSRDRGNGVG
jgi:peptidoglycan/LPS O-acetylase OafA/YrhL